MEKKANKKNDDKSLNWKLKRKHEFFLNAVIVLLNLEFFLLYKVVAKCRSLKRRTAKANSNELYAMHC